MKQKRYLCVYQDWRTYNVNSFFIVESDSLVHAIREARSQIRSFNSLAGFKCCYLEHVKLQRNESL